MFLGRSVAVYVRVCVYWCVGGVGNVRRAICCFLSVHMIKHTGPGGVTPAWVAP